MKIEEAIKNTYEGIGFAVIDIKPIEGSPFFEMEYICADGHFKKPVVTFFMIANGQVPGQGVACQPPS